MLGPVEREFLDRAVAYEQSESAGLDQTGSSWPTKATASWSWAPEPLLPSWSSAP